MKAFIKGFKYMRKSIISIIAISSLAVSGYVNAYSFTYMGSESHIDDSLKRKIDILVERKIKTPILKLKYYNALKKYDISKFSETKKGILNYLLIKFDPIKKNTSSEQSSSSGISNSGTPPVSKSLSYSENEQLPIYTPIQIPVSTIQSKPRISTNMYSSEKEKSYVETLKKNTREYAEVNEKYEFTEYGSTFRVNLKEYYTISTAKPLDAYLSQIPMLSRELLYKKGGVYYLTSGGYSFEKKLTISDVAAQAKFAGASEESTVFDIKDGYYYAFSFYDYKYYPLPKEGMYLSQYQGITSLSNVVLLQKGGEYYIFSKFGEHKLFPVSYLSKIKNPIEVLNAIGRDLYFYRGTDYEDTMSSIKSKTESLTKGMTTEEEKIKVIYSWITKNLKYDEYSKSFVLGKIDENSYLANVDNNVFSGLGSFKSLIGVCDGYTKLFLYMLAFAGVEGISIETGTADSGGRSITHAWNRIGEKLYDPTWDAYALGDPTKFRWYALSPSEMYKTHFKKTK